MRTTIIDQNATGENIRNAICSSNYDVAGVSKLLGISVQSVYKWQRGETLPSLENLYALAGIAHTEPDRLVALKRA